MFVDGKVVAHRFVATIILFAIITAAVAMVLYYLDNGVMGNWTYASYLRETADILLVLVGTYLAYRIAMYFAALSLGRKLDSGSMETVYALFRVIFYAIAIIAVLLSLGVNLSAALAGGAIGGIVLGLAVQTIATNILSGIFVASSRVLRPGDLVTINTGAWGAINPMVWGEITCSIVRIGMLWTTAENQYGNTMVIPNSILLGNILFTKLFYSDGLRYVKLVTVNADVPATEIKRLVGRELGATFARRGLKAPEIHLLSKNGGTNAFSATIKFKKHRELNTLIDIVNAAFDRAYWKARK
jgi:small-conductance mechanosensitive channel